MRKKVLKKPQKNPRIVSAIEKDTVQTHGYLGKKGYTIPKEHICNEGTAIFIRRTQSESGNTWCELWYATRASEFPCL